MKQNFIIAITVIAGIQTHAQIATGPDYLATMIDFSMRNLQKINAGEETTLTYSDLEGSPYYNTDFLPAKLGNTSYVVPIRYNVFADKIELLNGDDVYEAPKEIGIIGDNEWSKFTFEDSHETLVLINTYDEFTGYFFQLVSGKNRLLKKLTVKFKPPIPPPNHLIPGIPPKFENQPLIYFIKTEKDIIRIPKNTKELLNFFPENKDEIKDFIKKNNIKLNRETDLIKLVFFLNTQ
ncbi:MAG: hypothetical protein LBE36_09100 [Flavobacteriaceae bacterium]|jgi:hypothetical protein|nr:hypothetical protein [Flavobacteriaceae bacterium]